MPLDTMAVVVTISVVTVILDVIYLSLEVGVGVVCTGGG